MKFSWKGLILAPLVIPFFYSIGFMALVSSGNLLGSFLIVFLAGCVFSYCTTVFLFLPCLFLASKLKPLTVQLTSFLGAVLGGAVSIPIAWLMFLSSGHNSGPPQGSFGVYLVQEVMNPVVLALPAGGWVTALVYWFLADQPSGGVDQN